MPYETSRFGIILACIAAAGVESNKQAVIYLGALLGAPKLKKIGAKL